MLRVLSFDFWIQDSLKSTGDKWLILGINSHTSGFGNFCFDPHKNISGSDWAGTLWQWWILSNGHGLWFPMYAAVADELQVWWNFWSCPPTEASLVLLLFLPLFSFLIGVWCFSWIDVWFWSKAWIWSMTTTWTLIWIVGQFCRNERTVNPILFCILPFKGEWHDLFPWSYLRCPLGYPQIAIPQKRPRCYMWLRKGVYIPGLSPACQALI